MSILTKRNQKTVELLRKSNKSVVQIFENSNQKTTEFSIIEKKNNSVSKSNNNISEKIIDQTQYDQNEEENIKNIIETNSLSAKQTMNEKIDDQAKEIHISRFTKFVNHVVENHKRHRNWAIREIKRFNEDQEKNNNLTDVIEKGIDSEIEESFEDKYENNSCLILQPVIVNFSTDRICPSTFRASQASVPIIQFDENEFNHSFFQGDRTYSYFKPQTRNYDVQSTSKVRNSLAAKSKKQNWRNIWDIFPHWHKSKESGIVVSGSNVRMKKERDEESKLPLSLKEKLKEWTSKLVGSSAVS